MRRVAWLFLLIGLAGRASATTITAITSSTTWTPAGSPYVIAPAGVAVNIPAGVTLTIEPGVIVLFKPAKALTIANGGSLVANGQVGLPIAFQAEVAGNAWAGIQCVSGALLSMSGCTFSGHGGYPVRGTVSQVASLFATNTFVPSPDGQFNAIQLISSSVDASTTLTAPPVGFCYITAINATIEVNHASAPVLTIADGTVMKFSTGAFLRTGGAAAGGLHANAVLFTSAQDDAAAGDTDGSGPAAAPGQWRNLRFEANTVGGTALTNCEVRFGGSAENAGVYVHNALPTITGGVFHDNLGSGLLVDGNIPGLGIGITGVVLENNTAWELTAAPQPMIALVPNVTCALSSNFNGYRLVNGTISNSATLPALPAGFCYITDTNAAIEVHGASGPILTIASGVTIKFAVGSFLRTGAGPVGQASGGLIANSVLFTSARDDSALGDTDGPQGGPAAGQWRNLRFEVNTLAGPGQTSLTNCEVRYGGSADLAAVYVHNSEPEIHGCDLHDNGESGLIVSGSSTGAGISGNSIHDNETFEVTATLPALLTLIASNDIAISDGGGANEFGHPRCNAHRILGGTVNASLTLPQLPLPMCYYVDGTLTIPAGRTLTIPPGTVMKMGLGVELLVQGTLSAVGSVLPVESPSPIIFTSFRDDSWYGDTNGDGMFCATPGSPAGCNSSAVGPASGDWLRVSLVGSASSQLSGVAFRYGGAGNGGQLRLTNTGTASVPTLLIQDCFFHVERPAGGGIHLTSSNPRIERCGFLGASTSMGVENLTSGVEVNARGNWWGSPSGPNDNSANLSCTPLTNAGAGVRVSDCVDYGGFLVQPGQAPVTDAPPRPVSSVGRLGVSVRPNPVRRAAEFHVEGLAGVLARIEVLDASGRRVWSEELEPETEGERALRWDLTTAQGQRVRPGLYFVRVTTARASYSRHLVVIE